MDSEELVEEFFTAPHLPANTHEEWLLRVCAQLMDREARAVRFVEAQVAQQAQPSGGIEASQRSARRRRGCKSSPASTAPPTATGTTSWGDC